MKHKHHLFAAVLLAFAGCPQGRAEVIGPAPYRYDPRRERALERIAKHRPAPVLQLQLTEASVLILDGVPVTAAVFLAAHPVITSLNVAADGVSVIRIEGRTRTKGK